MSLRRIKIKNFQSIADIDLDIGRFTVLTGSSSNGKSAVIRAMHALLTNSVESSQIRNGSTELSVTAYTDKGYASIIRRSETSYEVNGVSFSKLNRTVPKEVFEVFDINADNIWLYFKGQFDGPFLVADSGSVVAKTLGQLTNVDVVFKAVSEGNKKRKAASGLLKTRTEDLILVCSEIDKLEDITSARQAIDEIKTAYLRIRETEQKEEQLSEIISSIDSANMKFSECLDLSQIPYRSLEWLEEEVRSLEDLENLLAAITRTDTILESSESLEPLDYASYSKGITDFEEFVSLLNSLSSICSSIDELDCVLRRLYTECRDLEIEYSDIVSKSDVCLLCGKE